MSNYSEITNQDVKNSKKDDASCRMQNENRELFKRALSEGLEAKFSKIDEETKDMEKSKSSRCHKIRMNRLFRERVCGTFLTFPELDNLYERMRSRLIIKLKINECQDRRKQR